MLTASSAGMAGSAAAGQRAADGVASAQELLAADAAKRGADASRRFSRCATHVFIAHFISTQTKLDRQRQQAQQAQQAKQAHQQHLAGSGGKFDLSSLYAARPGVQVALPSAVKLVRRVQSPCGFPFWLLSTLAGSHLSRLCRSDRSGRVRQATTTPHRLCAVALMPVCVRADNTAWPATRF